MFSNKINFYWEAEDEICEAIEQAFGSGSSSQYNIDGLIDECYREDEEADAFVPAVDLAGFWALVPQYKN